MCTGKSHESSDEKRSTLTCSDIACIAVIQCVRKSFYVYELCPIHSLFTFEPEQPCFRSLRLVDHGPAMCASQ